MGYGAHWLKQKYRETYTQPEVFSTATAMLSFVDTLIDYMISPTTDLLKWGHNKKELNSNGDIFQMRTADLKHVGKLNERQRLLILRYLHNATTSSYRVFQRHGHLAKELLDEWPGGSKRRNTIIKLLVRLI